MPRPGNTVINREDREYGWKQALKGQLRVTEPGTTEQEHQSQNHREEPATTIFSPRVKGTDSQTKQRHNL